MFLIFKHAMIILMKNVILAGVCIKDDAKVFQMKMDECIALCNACQLNVVETIIQSANSMNTISAFRKGKLDELRILVEELDADFVVFYNSLSVQMAERISAVGISTSTPLVKAAARVITVIVMAAPSMLMVAPRGIDTEYRIHSNLTVQNPGKLWTL